MKYINKKALLLLLMMSLNSLSFSQDRESNLKVGVGKSDINISDLIFPQEGFTKIHDKTETRAIILDNGINRIAVVGIEMTSLSTEMVEREKEIIKNTANVLQENIFIYCTHSFSSVHVLPPFLIKTDKDKKNDLIIKRALDDAVKNSILVAAQNMKSAKIGYGKGTSNVNINRDIETVDGWWHGGDEHGISDKSVGIIKFEDLEGNPLAILMNYGVQSSVMNESIMSDGGKEITSDLAGAVSDYIEKQYDNKVVALFACGAAGDQEPYLVSNRYSLDKNGKSIRTDLHEDGYILVNSLGEKLGSEVYNTSKNINTSTSGTPLRMITETVKCKSQYIPPELSAIKPTKNYEYKSLEDIDVPISIIQIGDIVLIGLQAELSAKTGIEIKNKSPFKNTNIVTLVNGAAKYMVDKDAYDKFTYEAMNSKYMKGSAEIVADKIIEMLKKLK